MTAWHATGEELATYRTGEAGGLLAASLETHLIGCDACRRTLAAQSQADPASSSEQRWRRVADHLDTGSPLSRRPVRPSPRLAAATRGLATTLMFGVAALLVVPLVLAAIGGRSVSVALLAAAPLAPMIAAALAYRPELDPAGELSAAAPVAGLRLVVDRAVVIAAISVPAGVLLGLALDVPLRVSVAWLLPGLAMAVVVLLAGTTRLDPAWVTATLGSAWAVMIAALARRDGREQVVDLLAGVPTQLVALAVAVAALTLLVVRRDQLCYRRRYP